MPRLISVVTLLACASIVLTEAQQQTLPSAPGPIRDAPAARALLPRAGTATISGSVVVPTTGQPVSGATVSLGGPDLPGGRTALTDAEGHFVFMALPAGRYYLSVSKQGHVNITYGQRRPGTRGRPLRLGDGEARSVALQLPRGGVITGMVLDERGEPAMNVHVRTLRASTVPGRGRFQQTGGGTTDDRGIYRIHSLQPGEYAVCTAHRNFGPQTNRQRVQMEIDALRQASQGAGRVAGLSQQEIKTRLAQLEAQLPHQAEPETGYGTSCAPAPLSAGSTLLAIDAGEERTGIDIHLQASRVVRVEGVLLGMPSDSAQHFQAVLVNADENMADWDVLHSSTDHDGRFRFAGVPPGSYTLIARSIPSRPSGPMSRPGVIISEGGSRRPGEPASADPPLLWGAARVDVSGEDVTGLGIELQRGLSVSGGVAFHVTRLQPPEDVSQLRLSVFPAAPSSFNMMSSGNGQTSPDGGGRFTIPDLVPGTYRFSAALPGATGWSLASATVDGHDILDEPLDLRSGQSVRGVVVTFTDQQTELSGVVLNEKGQPENEHMVLVYPTEEKYRTAPSRRLRFVPANADGTFTFRDLPPGEYRLSALLDSEPNGSFEPEVLKQLDITAVRVTLHAGEKKVQNVRASSNP